MRNHIRRHFLCSLMAITVFCSDLQSRAWADKTNAATPPAPSPASSVDSNPKDTSIESSESATPMVDVQDPHTGKRTIIALYRTDDDVRRALRAAKHALKDQENLSGVTPIVTSLEYYDTTVRAATAHGEKPHSEIHPLNAQTRAELAVDKQEIERNFPAEVEQDLLEGVSSELGTKPEAKAALDMVVKEGFAVSTALQVEAEIPVADAEFKQLFANAFKPVNVFQTIAITMVAGFVSITVSRCNAPAASELAALYGALFPALNTGFLQAFTDIYVKWISREGLFKVTGGKVLENKLLSATFWGKRLLASLPAQMVTLQIQTNLGLVSWADATNVMGVTGKIVVLLAIWTGATEAMRADLPPFPTRSFNLSPPVINFIFGVLAFYTLQDKSNFLTGAVAFASASGAIYAAKRFRMHEGIEAFLAQANQFCASLARTKAGKQLTKFISDESGAGG